MIALTIKLSYDPTTMNGSLILANKFFRYLIAMVKNSVGTITGLQFDYKIESDKIFPDRNDPEAIAIRVCRYLDVPFELMQTDSRKREAVEARQIAHYISCQRKNKSHKSLRDIGATIGNKDHATVMHSVKTVNNLMDTDKKFKTKVEKIMNIC